MMGKHEPVYNIYTYFEGGELRAIGIKPYYRKGGDQKKLAFLRERATLDFSSVQRVPLVPPMPQEEYFARQRIGNTLEIFEPLLASVGAGRTPLFCITPIVDGVPKIDMSVPMGPLDMSGVPNDAVGGGEMDDYLFKYLDKEAGTFDMPALINDDYFKAIRLLFNNRHYVSCLKLLMSFLDTIAYVEFGDRPPRSTPVFIDWLRAFSAPGLAGATPEELWEFRNSLLHMSNLESRKVSEGSVAQLMPYVGSQNCLPSVDPKRKHISFKDLIEDVGDAVENWIKTYNKDPKKMVTFIQRYDLVVSDDRWATAIVKSAEG
ncbi:MULTISPECIES: hypothetical protein [Chromobacterium]|uniref:hypothetical protein n=1 Tax=Chromobacterium TaxID=535 RepID=UPI000ABE2554|nr:MULTISPECIES: hypothetical protein [Chromobacterium]